MLAFVMASMMVAASDPASPQAAPLTGQPTRYCREMGSAASRSQAIYICRTKAQWLRQETCQGATRYCAPKKKVASVSGLPGSMTAFPLNEDSRMICRVVKITGSRLSSRNLCLAKREWDRMHSDTREEVSDLQDKYSKMPTNQ